VEKAAKVVPLCRRTAFAAFAAFIPPTGAAAADDLDPHYKFIRLFDLG
jgi:hypothetical protein